MGREHTKFNFVGEEEKSEAFLNGGKGKLWAFCVLLILTESLSAILFILGGAEAELTRFNSCPQPKLGVVSHLIKKKHSIILKY